MVSDFLYFGIQWTMPRTVLNLLSCWKRRGLTKDHNTIWNAIPGCLMWLIWRERNQRALEDIERHTVDMKLIFIQTLMDWMAAGSSQAFLPFSPLLMIACNLFLFKYISNVLVSFASIKFSYYLSKKKNFFT